MPPSISIIIPTHNRADLLLGAIDSVRQQSAADWELIVVDDGSTDDTAARLASLPADARIQSVYQTNQGRAAARNAGAGRAAGEYLGFLDSDDLYMPEALAAHRRVLAAEPDVAMSIGGYALIDATGRVTGERRPWLESGLEVRAWLYNCLTMPGAVLVRRDWFARLGGFDPACEIAEDWDFFLRLAYAGGRLAWVKEGVCRYRLHSGNSTAGLAQHQSGALVTLQKFFAQTGLPPALAAEEGPALAWLHVLFAQRAAHTGQPALARTELEAALQADPSLGSKRRSALLELLLTRPADRPAANEPTTIDWATCLPASLRVSKRELRQIEARVAMAGFYAAWRRHAWAEARQRLGVAVRRNPAWLLNRSVWAFGWSDWRGRHAER